MCWVLHVLGALVVLEVFSSSSSLHRQKPAVESEHEEGSEDNEDEWTYPESRKMSGFKRPRNKEKIVGVTSSPQKSGRGPGRPPKQTKDRGSTGKDPHNGGGSVGGGGGGEGGGGGGSFHSLKVSQTTPIQ